MLIGLLGTNVREILIEIHTLLFKKMHLNVSSAKWQPFGLGPNVLRRQLDAWRLYTNQLLSFLLQSYVYFRHILKYFLLETYILQLIIPEGC